MPSGPADAYTLLLASISDDDPVVFFEPKQLYRSAVEEVTLNVSPRSDELGKARVIRHGTDLSIVAWGQQVLLAYTSPLDMRGVRQAFQNSCECINLITTRG
jgi:pyruvate/2-oxoglutarate/acetoin dehydrogenase E1 component